MLARGYNFARRGYVTLSLPLSDAELDGFVAALVEVLEGVLAPLVAGKAAPRAARA
jgi:hypothetical protein